MVHIWVRFRVLSFTCKVQSSPIQMPPPVGCGKLHFCRHVENNRDWCSIVACGCNNLSPDLHGILLVLWMELLWGNHPQGRCLSRECWFLKEGKLWQGSLIQSCHRHADWQSSPVGVQQGIPSLGYQLVNSGMLPPLLPVGCSRIDDPPVLSENPPPTVTSSWPFWREEGGGGWRRPRTPEWILPASGRGVGGLPSDIDIGQSGQEA